MEQPKQIVKPEHITYLEYQENLSKRPHQNLILFVSTFFILLLAFLGFAKILAPDVDITIGEEPEVVIEQEGVYRGNVDNRLKKIQEEDNKLVEDTKEENIADEKVVIPTHKSENQNVDFNQEPPIELNIPQIQNEKKVEEIQKRIESSLEQNKKEPVKDIIEAPIPQPAKAPIPVVSTKIYKVYIGSYSSAAQAEVAKGILVESGLDSGVFVKNIGSSYTLQAGSYTSQEKANLYVSELLRKNFPARVVAE